MEANETENIYEGRIVKNPILRKIYLMALYDREFFINHLAYSPMPHFVLSGFLAQPLIHQ